MKNGENLTDEEKIFLLEDALHQAQWTVEFLHNCLVNPDNGEMKGGYTYGYPEQTLEYLKEWSELAPPPPLCHHSRIVPNCEACKRGHEHRVRFYEIQQKMQK